MTTKPNEPEAQKLRDLIAEIAADLSTENPFWTAKLLADALITRGIGIVPAHPVADAGGVTEDDVIGLINIVTDLAEVDALDKAYPEVWGRLDAMVNHAVAAATAASDQIRSAAHKALGEWLAWPDAARDGPAPVDDSKVLSWLGGVAQKLGRASAEQRLLYDEVGRLRAALTRVESATRYAEDSYAKDANAIARAALSEAREAGALANESAPR